MVPAREGWRASCQPKSSEIESSKTVGFAMNEPTITCANCKAEIKLTESLAAPLIEAARLQFEQKIAEKEAGIAIREVAICEQKAAIQKEKEAIDEQVSQKLEAEREKSVLRRPKMLGLFLKPAQLERLP
jgi:DNA replicative helicase MCM subunit Mcm2 (Cdc46/Mcm family)